MQGGMDQIRVGYMQIKEPFSLYYLPILVEPILKAVCAFPIVQSGVVYMFILNRVLKNFHDIFS